MTSAFILRDINNLLGMPDYVIGAAKASIAPWLLPATVFLLVTALAVAAGKLLGHLCDFVSCYHSHCAGNRCRCRLDCGSYHIRYSSRFPSVFLRRRSDLGLLCGPNRSSKLCSDFFATFGVTCGRYYGALSGIWVDDLMRSFPAFR